VKKARLNGVRGKGRTSRSVFLRRDARHAIADYLESERPRDADQDSEAPFLAASSISARRPGGRLSPRSVNTIVVEVGRLHDTPRSRKWRHERRSRIMAMPWPPPTHIVSRPIDLPCQLSELIRVPVMRAPVMPNGWPTAMAPPLTFSFSSGMPS